MKNLILILLILSPLGAFAEHCVPNVNSCGFYACEEKSHQCGPKGYPLGFGFKFCQVFLNTEQNYSPEAQAWLRKVRVCLMNAFQRGDESGSRTCGKIKTDSFNSHVNCYASTGFCDLSRKDKFQIFWAMRTSLIHPEILDHARDVARVCSSRRAPNPEALSAQR